VTTMPSELLPFGKAQTKAIFNLQKDLIELYEQASRAWLDRVKSEMELWSGLTAKLTMANSVPEAVEAYQKCVTEQMQMAAEDGRRLFADCQKITQKIAGAFNGNSRGNTAAGGGD
jgi:Phasin protein